MGPCPEAEPGQEPAKEVDAKRARAHGDLKEAGWVSPRGDRRDSGRVACGAAGRPVHSILRNQPVDGGLGAPQGQSLRPAPRCSPAALDAPGIRWSLGTDLPNH